MNKPQTHVRNVAINTFAIEPPCIVIQPAEIFSIRNRTLYKMQKLKRRRCDVRLHIFIKDVSWCALLPVLLLHFIYHLHWESSRWSKLLQSGEGGKVPPLRPPAQVRAHSQGTGQWEASEGPCESPVAGPSPRPETHPPLVPTGRTRSRWPGRQARPNGGRLTQPPSNAAEPGRPAPPPPPLSSGRPRRPRIPAPGAPGRKHPGAAPSTWAARAGAASGAACSPSPAALPPPGAARCPPAGDSAPRGQAGAALPRLGGRARGESPGWAGGGTVPGARTPRLSASRGASGLAQCSGSGLCRLDRAPACGRRKRKQSRFEHTNRKEHCKNILQSDRGKNA
ncbi:uncharacterized protein LOC142832374 [Microtus pennsylvanicus]|uniref:uncharacterized protein LOC142832374 n=1 Tax=Microtus pennsylvanicus TaxID=10058 RepID=UPI003F6C0789